MPRYLFILLLVFPLSFLVPTAHASSDWQVSPGDIARARKALYFVQREKWDDALFQARQARDSSVRKVIQWMHYRATANGVSFQELRSFIEQNPQWPLQEVLYARAEEALSANNDGLPPEEILRWFSKYKPRTAKGIQLLAESQNSPNRREKGHDEARTVKLIRQAWTEGTFGTREQQDFLKRYKNWLRHSDHVKRIDTMLWKGAITQAKNALPYVNRDYQKLFNARIQLMQNGRNANAAVAAVPPALQRDPGLIYERAHWRAVRKDDAGVRELLAHKPRDTMHAAKWWELVHNQIRIQLRDRHYQSAFNLASHHALKNGEEFAERQWLSGWIALRFLNNPDEAYKHFYTLYKNVTTPLSQSRGAYWAGRAAEANGNKNIAANWYKEAARYPATFYGQMALLRISPNYALPLPQSPSLSNRDKDAYRNNELAKVAHIFASMGEYNYAKLFLRAAVREAKTPGEMLLISRYGKDVNRPDLAAVAAREAMQKNVWVMEGNYPVLGWLPQTPLEKPLMHAIIRQESMFDPTARSGAGAVGMMQLLPSTANQVARQNKMAFIKSKLVTDPSYNVQLGSRYLVHMIDNYGGYYMLGIAAYNAGPGNVSKWLRNYGDPRQRQTLDEVIDWIELVPFSETRNYIQRVTESMHLYRQLMSPKREVTAGDIKKTFMRL